MQVDRHVVTDRAVRPDLVVVSAPSLQLFAGIRKIHEPVGVQAFRPQLAVERLDEAVVGGVPRPGEVQDDIVGIGPEIQIAGDEFAAVVDPDRLRITDLPTDPFQGLNHVLAPVGKPWIRRRAIARMDIHDGQDPQFLAQGELVMDKIHRPDLIRPGRLLAILAQLGLYPALGMLVAKLQAQLIVNPARLLDVHLPALPP